MHLVTVFLDQNPLVGLEIGLNAFQIIQRERDEGAIITLMTKWCRGSSQYEIYMSLWLPLFSWSMFCHKFSTVNGLSLHLEEMRESAKANLVLFSQTKGREGC